MRSRTLLALLSSFVIATDCCMVAVAADDDEYEEVVVRRKKKSSKKVLSADAVPAATPVAAAVVVPAVVTVPVAVPAVPAATAADDADDEPPPPPEPSAADAAEPRRLVRYFCKAWKDQEWERMWWAMNPQYRKKVSLKKFKKLFVDDAEGNGGLMDENVIEEGKTNAGVGVKVELIFTFKNAKHRVVKAEVQRVPGGQYRLVDSPIIPMDMDDL